jgi:hypothetical protein
MKKAVFSLAFAAIACAGSALQAVVVPYTEDFTLNNANWKQNGQTTFAAFSAADGPDGSSYISSTFNFLGSVEDDGPVLHRANLSDSASGGNLFGNWIAAGATKLSAYVRHNATAPLDYFARFTGAPAFPGVIAFQPVTAQPNTWTLVEFDVSPNSSDLFYEGGSYAGIFSNVSRIQFGASVPAALAGVDQDFTFDLDQVTVNIPEPSALALSLLGLSGLIVRRRNRV